MGQQEDQEMLVVRKVLHAPRSLEAQGIACCAGLPGAAPGRSEGRRSKGKRGQEPVLWFPEERQESKQI